MRKSFAVSSLILILLLASRGAFAQSGNAGDIASDLFKDLDFAQQNPAPEQKQIVESQVSEGQTVTDSGESNTVTPKDVVPEEIKTEKAEDVVNPEQTTSEQVKEVNVEVPQGSNQPESSASDNQTGGQGPEGTSQPESSASDNQTGNPSPSTENQSGTEGPTSTSTDNPNLIPGTTVTEPDDNAAPPTAEPSSPPIEETPTPTPQSNSLWQIAISFLFNR